MKKKVALIVLDGFGILPSEVGNAPLLANTPFLDELYKNCPKTLLKASSEEVGLPWGEYGNSEVGHSNIGKGSVVTQNLVLINESLKSGNFFHSERFKNLTNNLHDLHLIGLVSDGGVHSHINHLITFIEKFRNAGVRIFIHFISDGRDTQEKAAQKYIDKINALKTDNVYIATIAGRFYAMDRDKRWQRTKKAYDTIAKGESETKFNDPAEFIKQSYDNSKTDEFIIPASSAHYGGMSDNDKILFLNYRSDRIIQLVKSFCDPNFNSFDIEKRFRNLEYFSLVNYEDNIPIKVLFDANDLSDQSLPKINLPDALNESSKIQFRIAETEKFAHITYFFNNGRPEPTKEETYKLIPSPKVETYDQAPEMSAQAITDNAIIASQKGYDFILMNYANPDMLGHTGKIKETVMAIEFLDEKLKDLINSFRINNYDVLITADHGNCEVMISELTKGPDKEHSINPVPLIYISQNNKTSTTKNDLYRMEPNAILADIAPTILDILEIEKPNQMGGVSLIDSLS